MAMVYPKVKAVRKRIENDSKLKSIHTKAFAEVKSRLLALREEYDKNPPASEAGQVAMIRVGESEPAPSAESSGGSILWNAVSTVLHPFTPPATFGQSRKASTPDDDHFMDGITALAVKYPSLEDLVQQATILAVEHFSTYISKEVSKMAKDIEEAQRKECTQQLKMALDHQLTTIRDTSRADFLRAVENTFIKDTHE